MAKQENNNISKRFSVILAIIAVLAAVVFFKHISLLFNGEKYQQMIADSTVMMFDIEPNRGNLYSDDLSLLATSVTRYSIRFDALAPNKKNFDQYLKPLSDSLSVFFKKKNPPKYYRDLLVKARNERNRYLLLGQNLNYDEYARMRAFPLLSKGAVRGGRIIEQRTTREYPLGPIAHRSVGYVRVNEDGTSQQVGLEGAFNHYLAGKMGKQLRQKLAQGQWKPIKDNNEIEPQDGLDVVSTININIQDIAHHALLEQLEKYGADHGCAVVMEVATGEIKAISNLGRNKDGKYYERLNYAVGEAYEPGSVFKTMTMLVALEEAKIDTSYMVSTAKEDKYHDQFVRDSNKKGYGRINLSRAMQVSSNTGLARLSHDLFHKNPKKFVQRLQQMKLHQPLGLPIKGEAVPFIPLPGTNAWSGISLEWMAFGYGVELTPLQVLNFYNAIANDGVMVKPRLIKEVKQWNKTIEKFDVEITNKNICSPQTAAQIRKTLENAVKYGTGQSLYTPSLSMAGKTGTTQKDYAKKENNKRYISSFAGFFPAEQPKYSCIVVIHDTTQESGYYGANVAGPVFKSIAQKIYTNSLLIDTVEEIETSSKSVKKAYQRYDELLGKYRTIMPNVVGLHPMEAIPLLENMGLSVVLSGTGWVREQSFPAGQKIENTKKIYLTLSPTLP